MAKQNEGYTKRIGKKLLNAGSWKLARRLTKSIPYVGTAAAIGMVGYDIKNKGWVRGVLNSGIDAIPFVGAGKNAVELVTGDFFPDKKVDQNRIPEKS